MIGYARAADGRHVVDIHSLPGKPKPWLWTCYREHLGTGIGTPPRYCAGGDTTLHAAALEAATSHLASLGKDTAA